MNRRDFLRKSFTGVMGLAIVPSIASQEVGLTFPNRKIIPRSLTYEMRPDFFLVRYHQVEPGNIIKTYEPKKVLDKKKKACYIGETEIR